MPNSDSYILIGIGGFFLFMALIFFLWARTEERGMNHGLSGRRDLREFITRWPIRFETGALRVGGWIFTAIGLILITLGGIFLL
jgi:hypothetical protein